LGSLVLEYSVCLGFSHNSPPNLLILGLHSSTMDAHTRSCFPGDKAAGTWSCPLHLSNAKVENGWTYASTLLWAFIMCLLKLYVWLYLLPVWGLCS